MPFSRSEARGFTLVEIMVVIVILTIFAGMMTLSLGGSDTQRNRAFYEHLQSNLGYIRLLSAEKMQPYGLAIKPNANGNTTTGELVVVKLANTGDKSASWQLDNEVEPLEVPANILLDIQPTQSSANATVMPSLPIKPIFDPNQAPPIIWYGNGEATPVQIIVKKVNPLGDNNAESKQATFEVGNPIHVNASGAVNSEATEATP